MIRLAKILTILILLFIQHFALGQDTTTITRIGPTYYSSKGESKYFFICDGVPILKKKRILKFIDPDMIDSIMIHKDKIYNYNYDYQES